jgi:Leucine-rich repeat (LRR) protein
VPETLKDLPALTDIDLSGNPLVGIPEWLAKKPGLKNLSFSRTKITRLPQDISAWKSLQSLQLGELSLDAAEMKRIREALPDVAIVF